MAVLTFSLLGVAAPLVLFDPASVSNSSAGVLSATIVVLSAAKLSWLIYEGQPRLLSMSFHLFVYPFLGLAAFAQTTSGHFPLDDQTYSPELITSGLLLVLAGVVSYEVGNLLGRMGGAKRGSAASNHALAFSPFRVYILAAVGLVFIAVALRDQGLATFFSSRDQASEAIAGPGATLQVYNLADKTTYLIRNIGIHLPIFLALMAALFSRRWGHDTRGWPRLFIAVLMAVNIIVNNPISNSRFLFGLIALGLACVYLPWRTSSGFRLLTFSGLSVFILVFGLLDAFRNSTYDLAVRTPRQSFISDGTYSAFQTILNGILYVKAHGLRNGVQLESSIFVFVPRSLWAGKQEDTGSLIDPHYNRAASLWTEFQVDFGLVGVILGFFLLGFVSARVEDRLSRTSGAFLTVLPVLAGAQIFLLRGSLVSAMGTLYPLAAFFGLIIAWRFVRRPADDAQPGPRREDHRSADRSSW